MALYGRVKWNFFHFASLLPISKQTVTTTIPVPTTICHPLCIITATDLTAKV